MTGKASVCLESSALSFFLQPRHAYQHVVPNPSGECLSPNTLPPTLHPPQRLRSAAPATPALGNNPQAAPSCHRRISKNQFFRIHKLFKKRGTRREQKRTSLMSLVSNHSLH